MFLTPSSLFTLLQAPEKEVWQMQMSGKQKAIAPDGDRTRDLWLIRPTLSRSATGAGSSYINLFPLYTAAAASILKKKGKKEKKHPVRDSNPQPLD